MSSGANSDSVVNIETFGNTCQWFGPLKTAGDSVYLLKQVHSILAEKWFHGNLSPQQSEDLLREEKGGSFLLRFSSLPGFFTLSVLGKKSLINHHRIENTKDGYLFAGEKYSSLTNLIKDQRKKLYLVQPCAGSPYRKLFPKKGKPEALGAYLN